MFRSPNDASSSESESESHSDEEFNVARVSTNKAAIEDALPSSSEHVNLIAASLLEFHATVQAAEILNATNTNRGTHYDRHSPEAKALAKKLFASRSELLASHGVLARDLPDDEDTRQQYLTGISRLGIPKALSDASALSARPRLALKAGVALNAKFHTLPNISQLAIPSPPRLPGIGRYDTEFTEIKQLGRGGFGTVYHVINFVDRQPYAIKKIILDPKRLKRRWQEGGREEVENVLREIRTLAALEHSNIVRYFGAWIEGPRGSSPGVTELEGSRPPIYRRLLGEKAAEAVLFEMTGSNTPSGTIIPQRAHLGVTQLKETESVSFGGGIIFGEDSAVEQPVNEVAGVEATSSTISLSTETDIFTDGDGQGGRRMIGHSVDQITLCLQMSLHQLNLAKYLSPEPLTVPSPHTLDDSTQTRHCFHLKPSLCVFLGILSGVQYLHAAGIVHRDLKPANIFLSEDSVLRPGFVDASCVACPQQCPRYLNACIGDFGLVGNVAEELSAAASSSDTAVGTELYRPPSSNGKGIATVGAATRTRIDEKIDVFALGVLLFELLWRFDTKTERFVVLNALTKSGTLPAGFNSLFAHGDLPSTSTREKDDTDGGRPSDVDSHTDADAAAAEQEQTRTQAPELRDVGIIAECIAGMVHSDPAQRWECARVKTCVERVLQTCC